MIHKYQHVNVYCIAVADYTNAIKIELKALLSKYQVLFFFICVKEKFELLISSDQQFYW